MDIDTQPSEAQQTNGVGPPHGTRLSAALQRVVLGIRRRDAPRSRLRVRGEKQATPSPHQNELLAVVCHELRSPLASIRHSARLLGSAGTDAAVRAHARSVLERQVSRMVRLVDDLANASTIADGRMQLQAERVDLRVVVGNAMETMGSDIEARGHELTAALPENPVWLLADSLRLEQVFVNLLANAAKYTEPGGRLTVWVHARRTQAIVRIRDSGIGMAPQILPRIFDLFKQADGADLHSRSGLGIGLAVVRHLVELHGGNVTAASRGCGQGSEFTVCLPCEGSAAG